MKRICYVIPSLSVGGTERQLLNLIEGLAGDHEITVVCTHHDGALAGDARRLGAYVRVFRGWGGWDPRLRYWLRKTFRAHRPDIVHSFMFGFDLAANRAARETGVPVVISTRRELAQWKKPRHIRVQQKANRLVDCIVANSHAVAEYAAAQEQAEPSLFRVIHNGIDADQFVTKADPRHVRMRFRMPFHTHVIGIVANFSPVKDYGLFVAMAAELARRRADVHFLMVGSGPLREAVESKMNEAGLKERYTRIATLEELPDVYLLMSVCVITSLVEGFPNALMEAMASGTPVVAPRVGGIPELVEDGVTGRLVDSRRPEDFAEAVEALLDDPAGAQGMGSRAAGLIREAYTIPKMVGAHRALYVELLSKAHRRER